MLLLRFHFHAITLMPPPLLPPRFLHTPFSYVAAVTLMIYADATLSRYAMPSLRHRHY